MMNTPMQEAGEESRKRLGRACSNCRRGHLSCNAERPCKRCIARGTADTCQDMERKKPGVPSSRQGQDEDRKQPLPSNMSSGQHYLKDPMEMERKSQHQEQYNALFNRITHVYPQPTLTPEDSVHFHDSPNTRNVFFISNLTLIAIECKQVIDSSAENIVRILSSEPEEYLPNLLARIENFFPLPTINDSAFMGQAEIDINSSVAALREEVTPMLQHQIVNSFDTFINVSIFSPYITYIFI